MQPIKARWWMDAPRIDAGRYTVGVDVLAFGQDHSGRPVAFVVVREAEDRMPVYVGTLAMVNLSELEAEPIRDGQ
jgi:hypothetical protein